MTDSIHLLSIVISVRACGNSALVDTVYRDGNALGFSWRRIY